MMRCASSILNGVVAGRSCVGQRRQSLPGGKWPGRERNSQGMASASRARHGFAATPPSASRASLDHAVLDLEACGDRDDRERVGGALAKFQVARMRRERASLARQSHRDDQITRFEHAVALGRIAGQTVKGLERNLAASAAAFDLDNRVERDQRHAEIGWMRGDAGVAPAEHGMEAVLAVRARRNRRRACACCRRSRRHGNSCSAFAA